MFPVRPTRPTRPVPSNKCAQQPPDRSSQKHIDNLGTPVVSHWKIAFFFDFFLQNHTVLMPIWILFLKNGHESGVFLTKNVQNQKHTIQSMSFFALFIVFFPKTYRSHTHVFFWKSGIRTVCFWRKMSKIKNKLYYRCFICALFLIFFSKHASLMSILCFFIFLNRHESIVFLMKNVQNQKYAIISTSFLVKF